MRFLAGATITKYIRHKDLKNLHLYNKKGEKEAGAIPGFMIICFPPYLPL